MHADVMHQLQEIGCQLDKNIFPRVKNGGIVMPSDSAVLPSTLGVENGNEQSSRQRRPEAGSWKGTAGGQGPARGAWPPHQTAPVVCANFREKYEDELTAVCEAYRCTEVWYEGDGLWLLTESALLPALQTTATFLTGISFTRASARSWGFWRGGTVGCTWIGPRHTNFPDGSICAFEPSDGTWTFGDPLVELLDLYTLWALRHLHLQVYRRWPGQQAVHHPYERLLEIREGEYCGCGKTDKLYGECCRDRDLARNRIADAVSFLLRASGGLREPPQEVTRFIREQKEPPRLCNLLI